MEPKKFSWRSMGTSFEISIFDEISEAVFLDLQKNIIEQSDAFDKTYSRFIKTSFIWQIAGKTGEFEVEKEFMDMLKMYFELYDLSEKKFNPLIGFTISDMGYDDQYSLVPKEHIRETFDLKEAVEILSDTNIRISKPALFDVGGVGKGYFVDKISSFLKENRIKRFLVNGSGDLFYSGDGQKITAGLEHPDDNKKVIGTIELLQGSLAASGSNKRNWGKYHHIIDPISLSSPNELLASWVLADSAMLADALATCLFLCPPENFSAKFKFEYCLLNKDYKIKKSAGFTAYFF